LDIQNILFAAWTALIFVLGVMTGMAIDSVLERRQKEASE